MNRRTIRNLVMSIVAIALVAVLTFILAPAGATADQAGTLYEVKAGNATLNRRVGEPVTEELNGVPAEPVHSFTWNGEGREAVEDATLKLEIYPAENIGSIKAEWTDGNGEWTFEQTVFGPAGQIPHHPTGVRLTALTTTELVLQDPVPVNVYLHGNTTAGGPVLPTVFNYIATWGPAEVTLNGEPFPNVYDGPTPAWIAHTMTTVGVRNADGTVTVNDGTVFNPSLRDQPGDIDSDDLEFHLVFHDAPGPEMTDNFPPPHSFFYHLTFEDVQLEVKHGADGGTGGPGRRGN